MLLFLFRAGGVARAPVLAAPEIFTINQKPYLTSLTVLPAEEAPRAKRKKLKLEPPEEDKREETQRPEKSQETRKSGGWLWLATRQKLELDLPCYCGLRAANLAAELFSCERQVLGA